MKAYIGGNRTMCLAQPEDRESQDGYMVLYSDGSETWLTKEIFEFEYRALVEGEIDMIISTLVNTELTEDIFRSIIDEDHDLVDEIELDDNEETFDNGYEIAPQIEVEDAK